MAGEWPFHRLEDCLEALIDYRGKSPPKSPVGVPVLSAKVIKDGRIVEPIDQKISETNYSIWMRRGLPAPGDVVLTTEGPLGEVAQLDNRRFALGQRIVTMRGSKGILDNTFLKFLLKSPGAQQELRAHATGTTVEGISQKALRSIKLPIPSIEEQRVVANILGTLDDKFELNRRMNETLEAMARALFKSWFVDFDPVRAKVEGRDPGLPQHIADLFPDSFEDSELGEVPVAWPIGSVDEEFDLTMGQSPPGETYNEAGRGIPFYQGRTDFGYRFPTRRVYCTAPTRLAKAGDTLISVRAPVGDINMASEVCAIGRGVAAARHKTGSRSYSYQFMQSIEEVFCRFEAEGTVFGSISKKDFHAIPTMRSPHDLVRAFEKYVSPLDDRVQINESESQTLAMLRDTLLPKLISGEIRVKPEKFAEAPA